MPLFKKRSAAKGGGTSSAKRDGSGPPSPLPLPFPVPEEVQWLLRQWDLEAVIGRSIALYKRFWSLPRETQSLLSWGFLLFTVFFISGLWTLKLALLAVLLLFRPFESPEKRKERMAMAAAGKKGKAGKSVKKGKVDQGFSDDPLISALQRIPETFTFGNIPPSATASPAATPSRKVSSATTSIPPQQVALPRSHPHRQSIDAGLPAGSPLAQPPRYRPRIIDEPMQYDSSSSTDSRSSNPLRSRGPGLGLGPAPRRPQGTPIRSDRAVTAPLQQPAYRTVSSGAPAFAPAFPPGSTSTSGQYRAPLTPMLAQQQQQPFSRLPSRREESLQEEEAPLSVWEQQQRDVDLYKTGEARHKSASFHRLEQAQKFWNRKFSSSSHRAGEGEGDAEGEGYDEAVGPAAEVVAAVQ